MSHPRTGGPPAGEAHLWLACPDPIEASLGTRYEALLSDDERRRHRRLIRAADRQLFLLAHALVRVALSHYTANSPASWVFRAGEHGKPAIAGPPQAPPLQFNLSHTRGLVACAITQKVPCGVDVEDVRRQCDVTGIADLAFSRRERTMLAAEPPERRRGTFFAHWTLREAYAKAAGLGFALRLDRISFDCSDPDHIGLEVDPELGHEPAHWQLELSAPTPHHRLALALHRGVAPDLTIRHRWCVPLADEAELPR